MTFAATDAISETTVNSGANSEAGPFVPELWSDETLATYKSNLVVAQLVTLMNHVGKKGDTVNVPTISSRLDATQRRPASAGNEGLLDGTALAVTPLQVNPSLTAVLIDKHFEYSTFIEDFAKVQAKGGLRKFYTDDAGYSLSTRVDWELHLLGAATTGVVTDNGPQGAPLVGADWVQAEVTNGTVATNRNATVVGADGSTAWDDTGAATVGNSSSLADAGIRRMIRTLDDKNVPLSGRAFVIPPVEKENLLGIPRFTEQAFVGDAGSSNSIRNGLIGDLYSNAVYVSTNCPVILGSNATSEHRACQYMHKDAYVLIMQMNMRSQADYMQLYLSTLLTNDIAFGVSEIRGENHVTFIVPA